MKISIKSAVVDFFETEEKWMTLLWLSLFQFIPIVGFMVMIGYFARRFARKREGLSIPDFKFDDDRGYAADRGCFADCFAFGAEEGF
ncbi:MAG: hypothetical protein L3J39_17140 [Verrucomicrobiales bacterium]|nr:hypothetical protein [Verrucomicrobiales bacterium]